MDPLSVTASILAIIGAAEKVTKGLQCLQELRDAQEDAQLCCNEISALKAVCYQIDHIQRQWDTKIQTQRPSDEISELLNASLVDARSSLLKFDVLLQYRIIKPSDSVAESSPYGKVTRHRWLIEKKKIEKFRNEIRQARSDLFDIVELADLDNSMRIGYQITSFMTRTEAISLSQADSNMQILKLLTDNQHTTENLGRNMETQFQTFATTISEDVEKALQRVQRPFSSDGIPRRPSGVNDANIVVISTRPIRPQSSSCQIEWCTCVCHQSTKIKFDTVLSSLFGKLQVKISDMPILTPPCNNKICSKRRRLPYIKINYCFPTWLLARMLTTTLVYSQRDGIDVHRLRASRVVPDNAPIFRMIYHGNIEGIKMLFTEGHASPYDVNYGGVSVLWYAFSRFAWNRSESSMLELCKFILAEGADPHEYPPTRSVLASPFGRAWELILGKVIGDDTASALKSMFNDPDRLNDLQFSNRHRKVLGLPEGETNGPDGMNEHDIDVVDAMGQTPLQWAVLRNDLANVRSLLHCGASPNKPAKHSGETSMHFAARARDIDLGIIQLLLEHNGDINYEDYHQRTPLSRAIEQSARTVELLIRAGADVSMQDSRYGWTALHAAVFFGEASCVEALLEAGANPSLRTRTGENAVGFAHFSARIAVLEVFSRFRTIMKPAFKENGRGLTLNELQRFRQEIGNVPVSDEWWTLWTDLVDDLCEPEPDIATEQPDDVTEDDESSDDDEAFEDALETI